METAVNNAADRALHPAPTNACGWAMPASANVCRPVLLRTDVGLQGGAYTLSLSGTNGAFRVWPDASGTNAAPLLERGQTVTNGAGGVSFLSGADTELYIEAVSNGTATLTYAYRAEGEGGRPLSCSASLKMTAVGLTFVEAADTDYNFSPSLGETGTVRVAVTSGLPAGGMPEHHFKVEIVRETTVRARIPRPDYDCASLSRLV